MNFEILSLLSLLFEYYFITLWASVILSDKIQTNYGKNSDYDTPA